MVEGALRVASGTGNVGRALGKPVGSPLDEGESPSLRALEDGTKVKVSSYMCINS